MIDISFVLAKMQVELESSDKWFIIEFFILSISKNNDTQKKCRNGKCQLLLTVVSGIKFQIVVILASAFLFMMTYNPTFTIHSQSSLTLKMIVTHYIYIGIHWAAFQFLQYEYKKSPWTQVQQLWSTDISTRRCQS